MPTNEEYPQYIFGTHEIHGVLGLEPVTAESLVAREEIRNVVKILARATDRIDRELMASCYHEGAFDGHFFAIERPAADFIEQANLAQWDRTSHFLADPLIVIDGESAQVETYCEAHHLSAPDEHGNVTDWILGLRYLDRFECRNGRWRITRRFCAADRVYTLTGKFEQPADWIYGRRDRNDLSYQGV